MTLDDFYELVGLIASWEFGKFLARAVIFYVKHIFGKAREE